MTSSGMCNQCVSDILLGRKGTGAQNEDDPYSSGYSFFDMGRGFTRAPWERPFTTEPQGTANWWAARDMTAEATSPPYAEPDYLELPRLQSQVLAAHREIEGLKAIVMQLESQRSHLERLLAMERRGGSSGTGIPDDKLKAMIRMCHPDRNGGSDESNKVTAWLLAQRKKT